MRDLDKMADGVVDAVKLFVGRAVADLAGRIDALEARGAETGAPGKDGTPGAPGEKGDPGKDGRDGEPGQHGEKGEAGKDGVGLAGAVIGRDGNLVLTLTDGTTRDLGLIVGKDGVPGEKGMDGRDGLDGLGFDDMTEELADDGRTIIRRYQRGDQVKEFRHRVAALLDRGVYKAGELYEAGDVVTWAGSLWIAQESTTEKPDSGKGWRLSVKRGRDGKDGAPGDRGPEGPAGKGWKQ